jgi:ribosomal protein S18 acetylase RimI-like enzyme
MSPINRVAEVFDAIQAAKARATDLHTNFFPVQSKLQDWIAHGELLGEPRDSAAFFLRKDRDFWHLYFCAASRPALQQELAGLSCLKTEPVVTDLVGQETSLNGWLPAFETAGFRRHLQLQRLARPGQPGPVTAGSPVVPAEEADAPAVLALIENSFDRYGEQIPELREIEAAIENRQVLVIRCDGALAGLLFFETQGVASTVRFWVVAEKFRARRVGSALMQHYFQTQGAVRRFTLWVNANNENAIAKYRHYGYAPDGLVDHVLANRLIQP